MITINKDIKYYCCRFLFYIYVKITIQKKKTKVKIYCFIISKIKKNVYVYYRRHVLINKTFLYLKEIFRDNKIFSLKMIFITALL